MTTTNRLRRRALIPGLPLVLAALFFVGACSSGSSSDGGATSARSAPGSDAPANDSAQGFAAEPEPLQDSVVRNSAPGKAAPRTDIPLQTRAVISTGTVTLQSKDVEKARFDVQKVVDGHGGEISDEQTATDDEGEIDRSRLVIRVPSESFSDVMDELGDVAELRSAKRTSEDVTTEVIDIGVRVRAQEKSLERIELLLARAQSLRTIIAIESQLTRRQAELDSLKAQQAYLADQTSLSTITVYLEKQVKPHQGEPDEAGFLAGLQSGWTALGGAATVAATALGAVLPFALLLLLLGVPTWLLTRSVVRRRRAEPLAVD